MNALTSIFKDIVSKEKQGIKNNNSMVKLHISVLESDAGTAKKSKKTLSEHQGFLQSASDAAKTRSKCKKYKPNQQLMAN